MKPWICLAILPALLFLGGCAMESLDCGHYTTETQVTPSQGTLMATGDPIAESMPWKVVFDYLTGIGYDTAVKEAIKEHIGYKRTRSIKLFSLKMKGSPAAMAPTSGEGESEVQKELK